MLFLTVTTFKRWTKRNRQTKDYRSPRKKVENLRKEHGELLKSMQDEVKRLKEEQQELINFMLQD